MRAARRRCNTPGMVETFDDQAQLHFQMLGKVEQCRRLARQNGDQVTAQRLLDLANEYIEQIKDNRAIKTTN